jgi:hypothetical protein
MPFCPNCRIEYVADATRCAECGAALVPVLTDAPAAIGLDSTRPAELCQVEDLVQLDLIESQLHAAGIPSARRARAAAVFVPASQLEQAQRVLAGQSLEPPSDTVGLSELHRIRLQCAQCERVIAVDLLQQGVPASCTCGHYFSLGAAAPIIERYAELVRHMADADFEIELELPKGEE